MPRITDARREARRDAYLRAAWRCFARSGIHGVTMEQISAEAGTSSGAIYLYFESREAVIRAAITATLGRFESVADLGDRLPGTQLATILSAVEHTGRTDDGVDLMSLAIQGWAFAQTDAEAAAVINSSYDRILSSWARSARAAGLGTRAAREHAETMGCLVLGFIAQRALLGGPSVAGAVRGTRTLAAAAAAAS